ncbi:lymphocyte antigen 6I-like [Sinocyclocheilus anshuiensis]|uniref:lymphocyte antigen 6I-like n=1 Tax=Sinocyclocheilus anshuiensis TaxID=1608454 RepID=UPI0007BA78E1|nr:PREDICTED: lymphocyte antigen 6I-like [Sinocyclocheilus anshuiensis]
MMKSKGSLLILIGCLPLAVLSLRCYTCMFPAISPLDCLKFPQECPVGQRCIASTAVGVKGSMSIVLYERSCALPLQCDLSGQKHAAGINFNYTNECCDTDLCNTAAPISSPRWTGAVLRLCGLALLLQLG